MEGISGRRLRPAVLSLGAGVATFLIALAFAWESHGAGETDSAVAQLAAWNLAHNGTFSIPQNLIDFRLLSEIGLFHDHFVSDRPLGMILTSVPGQAFTHIPSEMGLALTSALLTAISVWAASTLWGVRVGLLIAAASPLLYTVSRTLWPETICIPILLCSLLLVRSNRLLWLLVPLMGWATICRPPFGLLALLVVAIWLGRRWALVWPALGFVAGIVTLYIYSHQVFNQWSLLGGYPTPHKIVWKGLWVGTVSFARGMVWWTPWLFFLRPRGWRQALVVFVTAGYVLATWLSFDAWGGSGFVGYRYAAPFAILCAHMVRRPTDRIGGVLFDLSVIWSVSLAIFSEGIVFSVAQFRKPWTLGVPVAQTFFVFALLTILWFYYRLRVEPELSRRKQARESVAVS